MKLLDLIWVVIVPAIFLMLAVGVWIWFASDRRRQWIRNYFASYTKRYRESLGLAWVLSIGLFGFLLLLPLAISGLAFFKLEYQLDIPVSESIAVAGLLLTFVFGFVGLLSMLNTITLLYYQDSQVDSYEELIERFAVDVRNLDDGVGVAHKGSTKENGLRKILDEGQLLTPSAAIGSISTNQRYARQFRNVISGSKIAIFMRHDFSLWHRTFIENKERRVIERIENGSKLLEVKKTFDLMFAELLESEVEPEDFRAEAILHNGGRASVDEDVAWACKKIKEFGAKIRRDFDSQEPQKTALIRQMLTVLCKLWHRMADLHVMDVIYHHNERDKISLLKSVGDAFPPCIVAMVGRRYYLCWIVPRINGNRNELAGFVSSEASAKRAIESLITHYRILASTSEGSITGAEFWASRGGQIGSQTIAEIRKEFEDHA